jgi:hypothetical protein
MEIKTTVHNSVWAFLLNKGSLYNICYQLSCSFIHCSYHICSYFRVLSWHSLGLRKSTNKKPHLGQLITYIQTGYLQNTSTCYTFHRSYFSFLNLCYNNNIINTFKKSWKIMKITVFWYVTLCNLIDHCHCFRAAVANQWSARKFWWSVEKFGHYLQFLCLLYCFIILLYYFKQAATNTTLIILL